MSEQERKSKNEETTTINEEFEVAASQVTSRVQQLLREGNIRRLIIRTKEGRVLLDTPLTVGAGVGGVLAFVGGFPFAVLAGIAAVVSRVKIEIVREVREGDVLEDRSPEERLSNKGDRVEVPIDEE
jgi:type III secretory pathway component EscV